MTSTTFKIISLSGSGFVDNPVHQHDTASNLFPPPIGITVQPKEAIE